MRSYYSVLQYVPYYQTNGKNTVRYNIMTASQVRSLSASQLIRFFTVLDGDEMKRTFSYQCNFLPTCREKFFSFGSEEKARLLVRQHLSKHVQQLSAGKLYFHSLTFYTSPASFVLSDVYK